MRSFDAFKRKLLKDPKVKAEYDALEEEFAAARKEIGARGKVANAKKRADRPNTLKTFGSRSK